MGGGIGQSNQIRPVALQLAATLPALTVLRVASCVNTPLRPASTPVQAPTLVSPVTTLNPCY